MLAFLTVEAVAWTVIGVQAASVVGSFGAFFYLGAKMDALAARLDARIDAQGAELSARIASLEARVDAQGADLGGRIDALSARLDEHLQRHAG